MIRKSRLTGKRKKKKSSMRLMIDRLDYAFNAMIRERDRENGCISCRTGEVHEAGHLVHAGLSTRLATRWHPQNVNGQCIKCNHFQSGNLLNYTLNVDEKYGQGTAAKLRQLSHVTWKPSREALEQLLAAAKLGHEQYNETWEFYGARTI